MLAENIDVGRLATVAGVGPRALLGRLHEVTADAPSEKGARRCFEARRRARPALSSATLMASSFSQLGASQTRMAADLPSTAFMRVFGGCGGVHACPYCSSPSMLSACCHLRRSEPLQWAEADALEMLR